jgi:hypothetical protein
MVNAGLVVAIAKMLPKLYAVAAQFSMLVASMHLQFKNLMESGAVYQKMIAFRFSTAMERLRYLLPVKYLLSPENKKPAEDSAGFLFSN